MTFDNTTRHEFGCACVDSDALTCFRLRYPQYAYSEMNEDEKCTCSCHDNQDECDCYECNDERIL